MALIRSVAEHAEIFIRHYIPSGKPWAAKNVVGTNLRNLALGFSEEFAREEIAIEEFVQEMLPDTTDTYIGRWERAVGIPDHCFEVANTLEARRNNVKTKLSLLGLQTRIDFENFAQTLGINIKVRSGIDHVSVADGGYGTELPVIDIPGVFADVKEARFTIVVTSLNSVLSFDYAFDFPFQSAEQAIMECVFNNAKPSNCNIMFTVV